MLSRVWFEKTHLSVGSTLAAEAKARHSAMATSASLIPAPILAMLTDFDGRQEILEQGLEIHSVS